MENSIVRKVFKKGSRTYFNTSFIFPRRIREDVFVLYSFVRTADDYVDVIPQKKKEFQNFIKEYKRAVKGKKTRNIVIHLFLSLMERRKFKASWVNAFFNSMNMDLKKKQYRSIREIEKYIFGSAEVIGLMMSAILGLPEKCYIYAQHLGKAMQYINFIRDIDEDNVLGRLYLPFDELKKEGLKNLKFKEVCSKPDEFKRFIKAQVKRYLKWQAIAEKGFKYIPWRYFIPIKTASDMYKWTALKINRDPFIIYRKKVKPSRIRIFWSMIRNAICV